MAYVKKGPTPWEQMGIEATLPGLRLAVNHISDLLRSMEAAARALSEAGGIATGARGGARPGAGGPRKEPEPVATVETDSLGRQYNSVGRSNSAKSFWANKTPEERKEIMRKRALKSRRNGGKMVGLKGKPNTSGAGRKPMNRGGAASPNHPRNPDHPGHAAWVKRAAAARAKSMAAKAQMLNGAAVQ